MRARPLLTGLLLLALFGLPLALPLLELTAPSAWAAWAEADRIAELVAATAGLCTLTLLLAFPPAVGLAVLLYRTDLPGRVALRSVLAVGLFVPLPLFALAWQSVGGDGWQPWTHGLVPAALIHAAAAVPWVVWLTGLGLRRVEPELEEDALTALPAGAVLWRVSLPRAAPALGLAAVWIVLQAAGEIAVTDLAVVRTFAEEVYTQFVTGGPDALGRAVAVSLPATLLTVLAVAALMSRWEGQLAVAATPRPSLLVRLGRGRWAVFGLVALALTGYVGVPLVSLLRQAGGEDFRVLRLGLELKRAIGLHTGMILNTLAWSAAAGVLAAGLAILGSWVATDSRAFRCFLFGLAVALWAVPGPVIGFGLKEGIDRLMDAEDLLLAWTSTRPLRGVLYDHSTPVPVLWAHVARLFPYALAVLWPAVRDVPRDLQDLARADGATAWGEFQVVVWPAARAAFGLAAVAGTALALGELAASKLVQVPGRQTFAQELFMQMHYGATATTAALALVQLALAVAMSAVLARWRISGRARLARDA